ncbi:MAG: hypothetical protein HY909_14970 [Deltaproteobacteria bacterium]|nr:hypothetical protein [Deltaproteobacteria bacterium]
MRACSLVLFGVLVGCAGSARYSLERASLRRMLDSPAAQEVAREAPEARAELARAAAAVEAALDAGEGVEDALADAELVFAWAQTRGRVAVARRLASEADARRQATDEDTARMTQQAQTLTAEVERLEAAREAAWRARQGASQPEAVPSAERLQVARELCQQARLLLAAASLLGATDEALGPARRRVEEAERGAGTEPRAALRLAGQAYTTAEGALRAARTAAPAPTQTPDPTELATQLGEAGALDPRRDERGVVAILRGLFVGAGLGPASRQRVETLGRILNAQGTLPVRLEVYVGAPTQAQALPRARAQAEALAAALRQAGVDGARLHAEGLWRAPGGPRPEDRVELVLVTPTAP